MVSLAPATDLPVTGNLFPGDSYSIGITTPLSLDDIFSSLGRQYLYSNGRLTTFSAAVEHSLKKITESTRVLRPLTRGSIFYIDPDYRPHIVECDDVRQGEYHSLKYPPIVGNNLVLAILNTSAYHLLPCMTDTTYALSLPHDPLVINAMPLEEGNIGFLVYQNARKPTDLKDKFLEIIHFADVPLNRWDSRGRELDIPTQANMFTSIAREYGLLHSGFAVLPRGSDYLPALRESIKMAELGV